MAKHLGHVMFWLATGTHSQIESKKPLCFRLLNLDLEVAEGHRSLGKSSCPGADEWTN
jgi:hypothetical protein